MTSQKIEPSGHIVFDVEIARDVDSVGGWDFTGEMGLACAVVYEVAKDRYRHYDSSELEELQQCLDRADKITSWNGWNFDLPVIYGVNRPDWNGHPAQDRPGGKDGKPLRERSQDLLRCVWQAQGLDPDKGSPAHRGWKLEEVGEALGFGGKCDDGALAPAMFQKGQWGKLLTYCQHDVWLTAKIERFGRTHGFLMNAAKKVVMLGKKQ